MMRKPAIRHSAPGRRSAEATSVPAPVGGWNMRDSEAMMNTKDALWMENWWPSTSDVSVRKGAAFHAQGCPGTVETLFGYRSATQSRLFGAAAGTIFDVAAPTTALVSGLTNSRWQHITFSTPGGTFILAANGADDYHICDGTDWKPINGTSTPALTGIDGKTIVGLCVFKHRVWGIQKDSMNAFYLDVDLFAGAAHIFPVGNIFTRGGVLVGISNWTVDGGAGVDDYLVFLTSEGEVAIYKGSDPTSISNFSLVGVFYIGEPLGYRSFTKFGGDLLTLTQTGLAPLSKSLQSATLNRASAISDKIDIVFSQAASAYGGNFGWGLEVFPTENILIANIPLVEGYRSHQLVMNTITGSWALFSGWNAACWETWEGGLYFGGLGFVAQALVGHTDFGKAINAKAKTAFNYFGSHGIKHFSMFRPIFKLDGEITINIGLDVNFEDIDHSGSNIFDNPASSFWDEGNWDEAFWAGDYTARVDWRTAFAKEGFCAALRLQTLSKDIRVGWSSTDFLFRRGSGL